MSLPEVAFRVRARAVVTGRFGRFVAVGCANTGLDVAVYSVLVLLLVPVVWANLVSTSCGLVLSYALNRAFVFRGGAADERRSHLRQAALFLVTTLFGLWVLQPLIILGVAATLVPLSLAAAPEVLIPKLVATCVTLVWNFLLYRYVVFAVRVR